MIRRTLKQSETLKDSSVLIGGTLVAQLIPIALQPVLRRIFTPEEFGIMAVYFAIVSILTLIASLNYQTTINLPKKDENANNLVLGALGISLIISLLVLIVILIADEFIITLFQFPIEIKHWLLFVPLSVLMNSAHLIFTNWLIRKKSFTALSINKISRRGFEGAAQLISGKFWRSNGLILGNIIGDVINFLTYLIQFKKTGGKFKKTGSKKINEDLKDYIHFPKYSLLPTLLTTIAAFLPILIISANYDKHLTGQYDLSQQMLALPLSLISVSISQVLLQKISYAKNHGLSIRAEIRSVVKVLTIVTSIFIPIAFFFGEELFAFVFGNEWRLAGQITEVLCLGYAVTFIIVPLTVAFIALEKLKLNALWQIFRFLILSSLFFFKDIDFNNFIILVVVIEIISYLCYGLLTLKILKEYESNLLKKL